MKNQIHAGPAGPGHPVLRLLGGAGVWRLAAAVAAGFFAVAPNVGAADVDPDAAADRIDALVAEGYAVHGVSPRPAATDEVIVRRLYLDLAGRIPTEREARDYLESTAPGKRRELVEALVGSPGYVSHQFNWWADLLRVKSRLPGQSPAAAGAYSAWIKEAIAGNMPYDEFVRALLTAEGLVDANGAVGFYLRDRGMPLDHLATTVQTFLGTQIVCAQCHDHPFEEWTQMDYYKMAAFTFGMQTVRGADDRRKEIQRAVRRLPPGEQREIQRSLAALADPFRNAVVQQVSAELRLPDDYQYEDAKPKDKVDPATPFGEVVEGSELEDGRRIHAFADWMASPTNPRFAAVMANRLWKRAMGLGIVEPVDDFDNAGDASNPALLDYLTSLLVDLDFDLQAFQRILHSTAVYGREAVALDEDASEPFHFPGPVLRRMSAEQVWDSLITLMNEEPDPRIPQDARDPQTARRIAIYERMRNASGEDLVERARQVGEWTRKYREEFRGLGEEADRLTKAGEGARREDIKPEQVRDLVGRIAELEARSTIEFGRIAFWGDEAGAEVMADRFTFRTPLRNQGRTMVQQLGRAFPNLGLDRLAREAVVRAGLAEPGAANRMAQDRPAAGPMASATRDKAREEYRRILREEGREAADAFRRRMEARLRGQRDGGQREGFVRASELPSPAPEGHFLQEFGQSDRDLIENASTEATVPQALALLNGNVFPGLTGRNSALWKRITAAEDPGAAIDAIYVAMLARPATAEESAILTPEFEKAESIDEASRAVVWALLNGQQFLFIQ